MIQIYFKNWQEDTCAKVNFCEFCEIFQNSFFIEHLLTIGYRKTWSGSRLLCAIILKRMLSDVLILVMWPKREHEHLQEVTKNGKKRIQCRFPDFFNRKYFTLILKTMILTALISSVTGTEIFKIQKQPPEVFLKFELKLHKIHGKTPMPGFLFS